MQGDKNKLDQVAIRMVAAPPLYSDKPVETPEDVIGLLSKEFRDYDREVVSVVNFRGDGSPINMNIVSVGTVNFSLASPREIFKSAILSNAANIMLFHNHPSGSPYPSRMDVKLTENVRDAAELMGISLMDHIILGQGGSYFSFKSNGLLEPQEDKGKKVAQKTTGTIQQKGEKKSIIGELSRHVEQLKSGKKHETGKEKISTKHDMSR